MKTLEQLGISPAPWSAMNLRGYRVFDHEWFELCDSDSVFSLADASLIAAAPELYEALRMYQEAFEEIRKSAWFLDANFHEIMSLNKVMTAADAALAKAAGESEVKDGK